MRVRLEEEYTIRRTFVLDIDENYIDDLNYHGNLNYINWKNISMNEVIQLIKNHYNNEDIEVEDIEIIDPYNPYEKDKDINFTRNEIILNWIGDDFSSLDWYDEKLLDCMDSVVSIEGE